MLEVCMCVEQQCAAVPARIMDIKVFGSQLVCVISCTRQPRGVVVAGGSMRSLYGIHHFVCSSPARIPIFSRSAYVWPLLFIASLIIATPFPFAVKISIQQHFPHLTLVLL